MSYYINKIVGWILSPYGMLFIGLAVGFLLRGRSWKGKSLTRLGNGVLIATFALMWVFSCPITSSWIGTPLEGDEKAGDLDAIVARVTALPEMGKTVLPIVLLGGGMMSHEKCGRMEFCASADRAWTAGLLWKKLVAAKPALKETVKVTQSGGGVRISTAPFLKELGVPEENMVFFEAARNTQEESELIHAWIDKEQGGNVVRPKILLVTSAWHMPRAAMLFRHAGFEVLEVPTDYECHAIAEMPLDFGMFFPSADGLTRNSFAIKEWVARLFYAIKYGARVEENRE